MSNIGRSHYPIQAAGEDEDRETEVDAHPPEDPQGGEPGSVEEAGGQSLAAAETSSHVPRGGFIRLVPTREEIVDVAAGLFDDMTSAAGQVCEGAGQVWVRGQ